MNISERLQFDVAFCSSFPFDPCFLFNFSFFTDRAGDAPLSGGLYHVGYQISASVPISASHAAPL